MNSPTRSRHRALLETSARSPHLHRHTVKIATFDALQSFVTLAQINRNIGLIVEDLDITLPPHIGYPAHAIRTSLRFSPNIVSLVINLPIKSPVTLFNGLEFPNLRVFSTNLPHRIVASFLFAHTSITALTLRRCGRSASCPLRGLVLPDLRDLQCPSRCLVGLAPRSIHRAAVNLSRLSSLATLAIQALSSSNLYSLTVDFFSNDHDILTQIVLAAPNLRKLQLNEKPQTLQRRTEHARRPWNDLRGWHFALMRLPLLREFMLRTLVRIVNANRTESRVVSSWVHGTGRVRQTHPSLFHVALIQKEPGSIQQRLSRWFKQDSVRWARVSSTTIGPTHSFIL